MFKIFSEFSKMEAQKAVDKLEDQIENLNSKIDDIENQLIEVHGNIRKVTSRMNATELGEKLSKKKIYLMDLKEKLQKDLKVAQKEKTKLEISISLEKDKRFPGILKISSFCFRLMTIFHS